MTNGATHSFDDYSRRAQCHAEAQAAYDDCRARGESEEICQAERYATFETCMEGLFGCGRSSAFAYHRCIALGGEEADCQAEGRAVFQACLRRGALLRRLSAHVRQEALEKMLLDASATSRLWSKVFADPKTAMIFARKMDEAFQEAKIEPEEGETFGCILTAGQQPGYISQLLPDAPSGGSRLFQIFAPKLMQSLLKADQKDRVPKT